MSKISAAVSGQEPEAPPVPVRVYIVDDHTAVRDSLDCLLQLHGFRVQQFSSAEAFLDLEEQLPSGVVLADIRLPGLGGLEMVREYSARRPDLRTIMLTAHGDVDAAVTALRIGAKDFLLKPYKESELTASIERQSKSLECSVYNLQRKAEARESLAKLTPREREVAEGLSEGLTNKEIAHKLDVSVRTVEMHRARAMERLGVTNFAQLVSIVIRASE
jgi:RNA polymerase sigma factor (sigma-70 family)